MSARYDYPVQVAWSEEDQLYLAEMPDLHGCIGHGETMEAALVNVREVRDNWLETAKESGWVVPLPSTVQKALRRPKPASATTAVKAPERTTRKAAVLV